MKCKFLQRVLGILLAGMMFVECSVPAVAAENVSETVIVEEVSTEDNEESSFSEESQTEGSAQEEIAEDGVDSTQPEKITVSVNETVEQPVTEQETLGEMVEEFSDGSTIVTAPTDLVITEQAGTSVTLNWTTVEECEGYKVYRSTEEETGFVHLENGTVTTSSNTAAYTDNTCAIGQIYYYKVTAYKTIDGTVIESEATAVVNNHAVLESITLNQQTLLMNKGNTETLAVSYNPVYTTDDRKILWTSSDEAVVTVMAKEDSASEAVITANGAGSTTITATVGDKKAVCEVTVTVPLESITLNKTELTLLKGDVERVMVSYLPADTTADKTVTWTSSAPEIVSVTPEEGNSTNASVTALTGGSADITATVGDKHVTCKVTVRIPATTLTLSTTEIELEENNDSESVTITVAPEDTTDTEITFEAKDEGFVDCTLEDNVLTIASNGTLGETEITVKAGNKTAVLKVCVTVEKDDNDGTTELIPVNEVIIDKTLLENKEDETANGAINLQLEDGIYATAVVRATVLPANATNQSLVWTSSNTSIATVAEVEGVLTVTAKGVGSAVITATADNGIADSVNVIVKPAVHDVYITSAKKAVLYCNADELAEDINKTNIKNTHQITMVDESLQYEYNSSNAEVATVGTSGIVTAHAPGKATITVLDRASGKTATMDIEVRRLAEEICLPEIADNTITVLAGSETMLYFSVVPTSVNATCLKTIKAEGTSNSILSATCDKNVTKGKIKLSAKKVGEETLTISVGDTYTNVYGSEVSIVSAKREIKVNVVPSLSQVTTLKLTGKLKMQSGTVQELHVNAMDEEGYELSAEDISIGFCSSNEAVAVVDANGKVTALKGGKAVITAYTLDGSNKTATYAITVEQRPEGIVFDREIYGVSKSAAGTATLKLKHSFLPASTAATQKKVTWTITDVRDAEGTPVEGKFSDYFTVSTTGVVSVKKAATVGMQATVLCTSAAYAKEEAPVTKAVAVLIQPKKVTKVKFNASALHVVGLAEHEVPFTTTLVKNAGDIDFTAISSNEEIATITDVTDGKVTLQAHTYGTVTLTVCADNAVTATCKVTVYPIARGSITAKESVYLIQQAKYDANDQVNLQFINAKKEVIDASYFTYKSSNPDIVYVDDKGVAYANPNAVVNSENATVTITAALKDDPDKRKATANVTVCTKNQIERMDVTYYASQTEANADKSNDAGKPLASGTTMKWESGQEFVLRVTPYDASGERIENPQIAFATSDTNVAYVKSSGMKSYTGDDNKKYTYEIVVRVMKPGKFSVIGTALDQKQVSRKISIGAYDGMPILASAGLGTIHKNGEQMIINGGIGVAAQSNFTLLEANDTTIQAESIHVKSATIQAENAAGEIETRTLDGNYFVVTAMGNNEYRLIMDYSVLGKAIAGTYEIALNVTRTALEEESGSGIGGGGNFTHEVKTTFTIADTMPKLANAKVTLNTFMKGDAAKLPIKTDLKIEKIEAQTGYAMAKEIDIYEDGDGWYVKLKDDKFDSWSKKSTSGKLDITLEGYEKPVTITLNVTTKTTKPVVKQQTVPSIQLAHGAETYITLIDAKKNVYEDYTVALKHGTESTAVYDVEAVGDAVKVTFKDTDMTLRSQGATQKQKITVQKDEWREAIELTVSVKAYNGLNVPKVTFAKPTLNMNRHISVDETYVETDVKVSHSNVELAEGEWTIPDKYVFRKGTGAKRIEYKYADVFKAEYADGKLKISLREDSDIVVQNATYTFALTDLWDAEYDAALRKPLTTANIKVVVKSAAPTVTVKMSGKLDLINRSTSTLKGTVTVKNMNSSVMKIELQNSGNDNFASNYYCIQKNNTFTLYARSSAILKTIKTTGNIKITMTDGTILTKTITFTPSQSTPKIGTPETKTIYKSAASQTVDYNFNADITKGVRVSKITTVNLPEGLSVQESNGHLFVTLEDKTLKAGTYRITVNLYLKGAQAVTDNPDGKPVKKTMDVVVTE